MTHAHQSRPPLVLHVVNRFDIGGMENGIVNLINTMPPERFEHAVVALSGASTIRARLRRQGVEVHSLDKRPGQDPAAQLRLWRLLRKLRPAIVHTRNYGTLDCQWVALFAGCGTRIHGEHGWDISDLDGRHAKRLLLRRLCKPVVKHYVAVSRDIARWLQEVVRVPAPDITPICNGVDTTQFSPDGPVPNVPVCEQVEGAFVFGTVGRIEPTKNQIALLEAFSRLVELVPGARERARLIIVGAGPDLERLRVRVRELGLQGHVWTPGSRDDVAALMRAFDMFVLPSLNEGISNTILEAMACGRAVIAGRVGGNVELIEDGQTGALYAPGNTDELYATLARYFNDRTLALRQGANARDTAVRRFSLGEMVHRYTDLYTRALAG
jgi:sugar transferase (PEP-CTERM/EpsH1 system associated)